LTADGPSTNNFSDTGSGASLTGSLGAAIPGRTGLSGLRYYSLATFPRPERISRILKSSYGKLARVDAATTVR
jgi:hypothetical protein